MIKVFCYAGKEGEELVVSSGESAGKVLINNLELDSEELISAIRRAALKDGDIWRFAD